MYRNFKASEVIKTILSDARMVGTGFSVKDKVTTEDNLHTFIIQITTESSADPHVYYSCSRCSSEPFSEQDKEDVWVSILVSMILKSLTPKPKVKSVEGELKTPYYDIYAQWREAFDNFTKLHNACMVQRERESSKFTAKEALDLSNKNIEAELPLIIEEIKKAAENGKVSIDYPLVSGAMQEKLKELGYFLRADQFGQQLPKTINIRWFNQ